VTCSSALPEATPVQVPWVDQFVLPMRMISSKGTSTTTSTAFAVSSTAEHGSTLTVQLCWTVTLEDVPDVQEAPAVMPSLTLKVVDALVSPAPGILVWKPAVTDLVTSTEKPILLHGVCLPLCGSHQKCLAAGETGWILDALRLQHRWLRRDNTHSFSEKLHGTI